MLHDVSRGDGMRIKRIIPNADDTIPPEVRMAHDTTQITYVEEGDTDVSRAAFKNNTIEVYDSTGTKRARTGRLPDGDGGIVVSKENVSVDDLF